MTSCPSCGSNRVFRSKTRTALERFRRQLTMKRPYRCHACNWRGWAPDGMQAVAPQDVLDAAAAPPDLSAIDAAISGGGEKAERQPRRAARIRSKKPEGPADDRQKQGADKLQR